MPQPAIKRGMVTHRAVWLANVTGMDGSKRPAYCRICEDSAYREDDEFVVGETAYACESGGFRVLDAAPRTIHPDTFADLLAGSR